MSLPQEVFYLFYGNLAETNPALHLSDTDEKSLEEFLRFLYTDECDLTADNVVSVLYLSKKYIVPSLMEECVEILQKRMGPENLWVILEQAINFDVKDLEKKCWNIIEWRTSEVTASENFNNIRQGTLDRLLKRNNLNIPEIELFQSVLKWREFQCAEKDLEPTGPNKRSVIDEAIYGLRFLAMSKEDIENHVSSLLTTEELDQVYQKLDGIDSLDLKWNLPERTRTFNITHKKVTSQRFPCYGVGGRTWIYKGELDRLCFSVSEDAMFHGVRLFGNTWASIYTASLEVSGAKVEGRYKSELDKEGIPGFNVMFRTPIALHKDELVTMCAKIKGPPSFYGWRGRRSVEVLGVTVTFSDVECASQRTGISEGQFHELILSI